MMGISGSANAADDHQGVVVADVFHFPDCCYVIYSEIKDTLVKNAFSGDVTYEGSDAGRMLLKCFDGVGVGCVLLGHSLALLS